MLRRLSAFRNIRIFCVNVAPFRLATTPRKSKIEESVTKFRSPTKVSTSVSEKVQQAAKDVTYAGIIIGGITLTGFILYVILRELFSKKSPNGVFNKAFRICRDDVHVQDLLGTSIKAHGEVNNRGRRRHTANQMWYDKEGKLHMAMKFYLKGSVDSGVVHLEAVENEHKDFEYKYLIVENESGFTRKQVVVLPASDSVSRA